MAGKRGLLHLTSIIFVKGLECIKGLGILAYRIFSAKKVLRKKSVLDLHIWHILILGFVNAFGYILPTLYIFKKDGMSVFEYLFQSLYVDLIFTILLSLVILKRAELHSPRIVIPIIICLFGLAFHQTVSMSTMTSGSIKLLSFSFSSSLPET
jgi:hypothetical protein